MDNERYQRQLILKGFGATAQQKLANASVLVVGAGGLGVPMLTYLNAMGVGRIGILDGDTVSFSNLHRQVLYVESDVGLSKVDVAKEKLSAQNSNTVLEGYNYFLTKDNALETIAQFDIVVDASDNFPTRYLVNDACVLLKKPFVYGALHAFEGQVSVFNYQKGPTYRCLFPNMPKPDEVPDCNENGVLGILPGIVGNLQALETIKLITGVGEVLSGQLALFDGLGTVLRKIRFSAIPENLQITALRDNYELECAVAPVTSVTALEFQELLELGNPQVIDVRTLSEYEGQRLSVARHIPLTELEQRKDEIDVKRPVYFLCQSGIRSAKGISLLASYFPKATLINVTGGMNQLRSYAATH